MFVRRLKSKNGMTYVQVVDKSSGRYKVLKSFGSADSEESLNHLIDKAEHWMKRHSGLQELGFSNSDQLLEQLVNSIDKMTRVGFDHLLGKIFNGIGFNRIGDDIFKQLVISRIAYPKSKLKTTEYLIATSRSTGVRTRFTTTWISYIPAKRIWHSKSVMSTRSKYWAIKSVLSFMIHHCLF